ncbi:MAG: DMT family transporter [Kineosporiaceae bacterium]
MSHSPAGTGSGVALVLVAVGSVQVGAGLATQMFPLVGPGGAVWVRLLLAAVLMAVVVPWTRLPLRFWTLRGLGWPARAGRAVVAFGAGLALMNWAFYEAIARIPLGVAVALEFAGPLALAMALSRRVTDALWALGAVVGIAAVTLDPEALGRLSAGLDPVGVLLALTAGALWAAYILLSRLVGQLVPGTHGLSVALLVGTVLLAPVGLATGERLLDWRVLGIGLGVAVLSTALAYGLELEALRRLPARLFGILMSVEPVVAALVGLVLVAQVLAPLQWVGVVIVTAVSVGATLTARTGPQGRRRGRITPGAR